MQKKQKKSISATRPEQLPAKEQQLPSQESGRTVQSAPGPRPASARGPRLRSVLVVPEVARLHRNLRPQAGYSAPSSVKALGQATASLQEGNSADSSRPWQVVRHRRWEKKLQPMNQLQPLMRPPGLLDSPPRRICNNCAKPVWCHRRNGYR
jgi:hypothetical protein